MNSCGFHRNEIQFLISVNKHQVSPAKKCASFITSKDNTQKLYKKLNYKTNKQRDFEDSLFSHALSFNPSLDDNLFIYYIFVFE